MHQLMSPEINHIAGGYNMYSNTIILFPQSAAIEVAVPPNGHVVVRSICTHYDIVTPSYDSYGYYMGDVITPYQSCSPV